MNKNDSDIILEQESSLEDENRNKTDITKIKVEHNSYEVYHKIKIEFNNYKVYKLSDDKLEIETNDIEDLLGQLLIEKEEKDMKVSRILKFQYLLNDINNGILTISHPSNFEDKSERFYGFENKTYMCCFSNSDTIGKNDYAWWKVYGNTNSGLNNDNSLDNIKVRITFNKKDLLKNILLNGNSDYEYYFGDIQYNKNLNKTNDTIEDFFKKSKEFEFENEFRILIQCKNGNNNRIKRDDNNLPHLLELPINIDLYKNINLDNKEYSFDPYKNIEERDKNAIKYLLKEAQDKI